jgi:hypothetical protein
MSDSNDKQWRIDGAHHLKGAKLRLHPYTKRSETWDHDHCAACFAKFAEFEGPDILHVGYATTSEFSRGADYAWVCPTCFEDLKEEMGWVAVADGSG